MLRPWVLGYKNSLAGCACPDNHIVRDLQNWERFALRWACAVDVPPGVISQHFSLLPVLL